MKINVALLLSISTLIRADEVAKRRLKGATNDVKVSSRAKVCSFYFCVLYDASFANTNLD